ncbi:MAG: PTS transporter subunit EIIA [Clostridiaceae bacterium]|nr:PTS transporter subunit EIIA [Clostridiaceae bacterium]
MKKDKKNDKKSELLRILSKSSEWMRASMLADILGISERTVRNYVREINETGQIVIRSSYEGYRLRERSINVEKSLTESETRVWRILSDLLVSKDGINAFDEAERLYVSASTITNTIIPRIKEMVREYDLRVESQKFTFYLRGSELNKRRLIGNIAVGGSYGFFNTRDVLEHLFPAQDISGLMQMLYKLCQDSRLYLNDFAMNNLLIHLLVILIRLGSDDDLEEKESTMLVSEMLANLPDREAISDLAQQIASRFVLDYGIHIPERDYKQVLALIALSVEHELVDIQSIVSQSFIDKIAALLDQVSQHYYTPEFSNDFVQQFSLHMYYAQQRCAFHISYPNPIGSQFKMEFAPIYDMAVFFAHQFSHVCHVEFNEDEIAFIALHFGSFLENNKQARAYISCIVVVESYHSVSKRLVEELNRAFADRLVIQEVLPVNRFQKRLPTCDLLITTMPLNDTNIRTVQINPILTRQSTGCIRAALDEIDVEREFTNARGFLRGLFHPELYFRNIALEDAQTCIRFMGMHCLEQGYVSEDFIEDVLRRESFSSTAFTDILAVPHAISHYAERSFICVVHNNAPIQWGGRAVHFVLLIGITETDMKHFKAAFDLIVELFSHSERTIELLKTNSFEDFCDFIAPSGDNGRPV